MKDRLYLQPEGDFVYEMPVGRYQNYFPAFIFPLQSGTNSYKERFALWAVLKAPSVGRINGHQPGLIGQIARKKIKKVLIDNLNDVG